MPGARNSALAAARSSGGSWCAGPTTAPTGPISPGASTAFSKPILGPREDHGASARHPGLRAVPPHPRARRRPGPGSPACCRPCLLPAPRSGHDVRVIDVSGGAPGWLTAPGRPGRELAFDLPVPASRGTARDAGASIGIRAWSPAGAADDEPVPLLVVHDGPEYDRLASLTRYLAAGAAAGWLPRLRAALLGPGPRDRWYSANTSYARALALAVLPAVASGWRPRAQGRGGHQPRRAGDAARALPAPRHLRRAVPAVGQLLLPRFDSHEQWFPLLPADHRFVAAVHRAASRAGPAGSHRPDLRRARRTWPTTGDGGRAAGRGLPGRAA